MRWLPALSMMLVSVISYIDRNTLALLAPTILKDIGLSNEQYGYIIAAFSVAYCIGNPVWGRILDRFGVHNGMAASVSLWTLASVSHVFAGAWAASPSPAPRSDLAKERPFPVHCERLRKHCRSRSDPEEWRWPTAAARWAPSSRR